MGFNIIRYADCNHVLSHLSGEVPDAFKSQASGEPMLGLLDTERRLLDGACRWCRMGIERGARVQVLPYDRCVRLSELLALDKSDRPLDTEDVASTLAAIAYSRRLQLRICLELAWLLHQREPVDPIRKPPPLITQLFGKKQEAPLVHQESYEECKALVQETGDVGFYLLVVSFNFPDIFELLANFNELAWTYSQQYQMSWFFERFNEAISGYGLPSNSVWWADAYEQSLRGV